MYTEIGNWGQAIAKKNREFKKKDLLTVAAPMWIFVVEWLRRVGADYQFAA